MNELFSKRGVAMPALLGVIAVIIVVVGIGYFASKKSGAPVSPTPAMEDKASGEMMEKTEGAMMDKTDKMMEGEEKMMQYSGAVLAGNKAPLLDFKKADYEAAKKTGKLIVLYFYANWCPICREEVPNALYPTFNELQNDRVIGFRVNYKDDETDADETALAREFGVGYQHTKVFVKNGARVLKAPDSWDKARYLSEINKFLP